MARDFAGHGAGAMAALALAAFIASPSSAQGQVQAPAIGQGPIIPKGGPKPARLPDGHPNWTGFWTVPGGLMEVYSGPSGVTPAPGRPAGQQGAPRPHPPLTPPYQAKYDTFRKDLASGKLALGVSLCLPPGMPSMMGMIYGMEFLQTPGQITITSEWQAASRRIWLNETKHPPAEELDPTYAGHSIGHWEGDTLVVDTVGLRPDVTLDFSGLPHSDKLRVMERFSQLTPGRLTDEITINDPDAFGAPWKYVISYNYRPDLKLQEYVCEENNRNVGANGEAKFEQK